MTMGVPYNFLAVLLSFPSALGGGSFLNLPPPVAPAIVAPAPAIVTNYASLCYNDQFANACKAIYNGFVDGRNCFFLGNNLTIKGDVSSAWDICNSQGATMASIFTQSEYDKTIAYLQTSSLHNSLGWTGIWLPMMNIAYVNSGNAISLTQSFWYQNMTSYNQNLNAGNTWIRYHAADSQISCASGTYPYSCVAFDMNFKIVAGCCQGNAPTGIPLCQITIAAQNFTKTNTCIEETPIETVACTTVVTCAKACESRYWCRSFNLVGLDASCGATCQMFTWSAYDTCPTCAAHTVGKVDCVHFNYVV